MSKDKEEPIVLLNSSRANRPPAASVQRSGGKLQDAVKVEARPSGGRQPSASPPKSKK